MTNSLIKLTQTVTEVGTETIPAIPYKPATPPRTVMKSVNVCMFRYAGKGHYEYSTDPSTGQTTGIFVPDAIMGYQGGMQGTWACTTELVTVTEPGEPAQPYVPARVITTKKSVTNYNLGWNAGARSIKFFRNDGYAEFKVRPDVVGAICGLNFYDEVTGGYTGKSIDFAFYCARGLAWVCKNGVLGVGVGGYTAETVFRIERTDDEVTMLVDGATVHTASTTPGVPAYLEASIYKAGDEVFDPVIASVGGPDTDTQTGSINASFSPMSMAAWDRPGRGFIEASFMPLTIEATGEGAGGGGIEPSYAVIDGSFPELSMYATGLTGEVGTINASFLPMKMLAADHPYGEIFASFEPMEGTLMAYEGNLNASMGGVIAAAPVLRVASFLAVTMTAAGAVSSAMTVSALMDEKLLAAAAGGATYAVNAIHQAIMLSLSHSGDVLTVPDSDSETWVVNLDEGGSTTYTNYGFNSFATIGGRHYGAGPGGVFLLEGDTDDGAPIRASVGLGKLSFGSAMKKTVSECYMGLSSEGNLFVKVIAEGQSYLYKTTSSSSELRQQRVKLGKGLKTNYVELEIYNEGGADFELDSVEFRVADLSRRI
jgi:hypothetical protein